MKKDNAGQAAEKAQSFVTRLENTVKEHDRLPGYTEPEQKLLETVIPDAADLDHYEVKLRGTQIFLTGALMMALPAFLYIWLIQQFAESIAVMAGLMAAGVTVILFLMYRQTERLLDKMLFRTRERAYALFWSDVQKNAENQPEKTSELLTQINAQTDLSADEHLETTEHPKVPLDLYYRIGFAYSLKDPEAENVLLGKK